MLKPDHAARISALEAQVAALTARVPNLPVRPAQLGPPQPLRRFQLWGVLVPFGNCPAGQMHWNGSDWSVDVSGGAGGFTVYDSTGRHFGLSYERGWCAYKPDTAHWEVVSMDGLVRRGVLDGDLAPGGSATLTIWGYMYYFGAGGDTPTAFQLTVWDWSGRGGLEGDHVFVKFDEYHGKWFVLDAPTDRIRVILQDPIDQLNAPVSVKRCTPALTGTGAAFDAIPLAVGLLHSPVGAIGYASRHADSGEWEIDVCTNCSHWLEGTLNSGLLTTDASVLGTVTRHWWNGEGYWKSDHTFTSSNGGTVILKNTGGFTSDAGDWFRAIQKEVSGQGYPDYILDNAGCAGGSS